MEEDDADAATSAAAAAAKRIKAAAKGNGAGKADENGKDGGDDEDELAKFNLDDYDKEESRGAGASYSGIPVWSAGHISSCTNLRFLDFLETHSYGSFQQHQGLDVLWRQCRRPLHHPRSGQSTLTLSLSLARLAADQFALVPDCAEAGRRRTRAARVGDPADRQPHRRCQDRRRRLATRNLRLR